MTYKQLMGFLVVLMGSLAVQAEHIEFNNGDSLNVTIIEQTETTVTFVHSILGKQVISKEQLKNLDTLNLTSLIKVPAVIQVKPRDQGIFGTGLLQGWSREVALGFSGASGATENIKIHSGFNTFYEDDAHKWDFKSFYLYSGEGAKATENKINLTLVKDWFFKDTAWFGFTSVAYDWDQFKDWTHRIQVSVGPAYKILKTDEFDLSARIGGTGIFEFAKKIDNPNNDKVFDAEVKSTYIEKDTQNFEMMLGMDFIWQVTKKQSFSGSNYFYPGMTDSGEFRNVTEMSWVYDLDFLKGLVLKLGMHNEYDTSETEVNDLKYNASLGFGF